MTRFRSWLLAGLVACALAACSVQPTGQFVPFETLTPVASPSPTSVPQFTEAADLPIAPSSTPVLAPPAPPIPSPLPPTPTPRPAPTLTPFLAGYPILGQRVKNSGCRALNGLPDRACTPGALIVAAMASQICVPGYTKLVRSVSSAEREAVFAEYDLPSHAPGAFEVDHLISLELGGSNDIANLWPELASPSPGFHEKDRVENELHARVCAGTLALADAQRAIAWNWIDLFTSNLAAVASLPGDSAIDLAIVPPVAVPTVAPVAPAVVPGNGATAKCRDGTYSYAAHHQGACSHHGGVAVFYK